MAVGNESDLQVVISVNTEQVEAGFRQIVNMADSLVREVEAKLARLDFSRVFDSSKMASSVTKAVDEISKGVKPLIIEAKVKVPKGKTVKEGGMADVDKIRDTLSGKRGAAEETKAASIKETHTQIINRYTYALREEAKALERIKDLQDQLSRTVPGTPLHGDLEKAIGVWQARANMFGERAAGLSGKYGGKKWFDQGAKVEDTKSVIAVRNAEKEITREKQKQAEAADKKKEAEREALTAIAAANQIYRIAHNILSRIVSVVKDWVSVSNEIYQSQLKLGAALRVGNELSNEQVRATYEMVENMSKANGLSLEMNYSAAQMLASYVGTSEELQTMLGSLDDLVIKMYGYNATAEQAKMVAKQLGRALNGNVDILQRQGIVLTENEKAILKDSTISKAKKIEVLTAAISRVTGDMSQESRTWAGTMGRIRVYGEIIKNNFGEALQNALKPMLDIILGISQGLATISEWAVSISKFAFGENIKGAEELSNSVAGLNDELDDLQKRLLGFDKFNVLSGSDTDWSSIFGGDKKDGGSTDVNVDTNIKDDGEDIARLIGEITGASDLLRIALTGIGVALGTIVTLAGVLMAAGFVAKLKTLYTSLNLTSAGINLTKGSIIGLIGGVTLLITGITTLISTMDDLNNWDELTGVQRATVIFKLIAGFVMSIAGAFITATACAKIFGKTAIAEFFKVGLGAKALKIIMDLLNSSMGLFLGLLAIGAAVGYFISSLDKMSNAAKVLIPVISALIGVMTAFAVSKAAAQAGIAAGPVAIATAGMLAAALAMAVGTALATANSAKSVSTHANGGIPDRGQLFIANEQGPELIGQIGGRTSVANNAMIVEAIEEAAYRGFSRANDEGGSNGVTLTLQGDAVRNDALVRALMPALKTEVKRQGGLKKAFGEN